MIGLLKKLFNKNDDRGRWGVICSVMGICLNVLLFAGKYLAGLAAASVSVTADAFNNLSDAGSSLITLFGFKLAGKQPDKSHPFGHGRIEYMAGFAVSALIIVMAYELAKSSFVKILHPAPTSGGPLTLIILAVSIAVKLFMFLYNSKIGRRIDSSAVRAAAVDNLSDAVSTLAVLAAALLERFFAVRLDGWIGLAVSLFIFYTGFSSARDTLGTLLGRPPSPELVKEIERLATDNDTVVGIHDLIVHDYGPGRLFVSLHAEVPDTGDINEMHDVIDNIEREMNSSLGCEAVIHMDPVSCDDEEVSRLQRETAELVGQLDGRLKIHDFRIVTGSTHTNLIFDVVVPPGFEMSDGKLHEEIQKRISDKFGNYYAVIKTDHFYI
ncbi:MAG: cation transporter [Oscillospiraceae bacterium]|nr:cation transporter [Oscillospiraceae bacterium]